MIRLKLPVDCKHLDLTDSEKVFANFMLNVANLDDHKAWMTTTYNMFSIDLVRIIGQSWWKTNLNAIFEIGRLNAHTGSVRFRDLTTKGYSIPDFYLDTIEDEEAIRIHMYLIGRLSTGISIFSDAELLDGYPTRVNAYAITDWQKKSDY